MANRLWTRRRWIRTVGLMPLAVTTGLSCRRGARRLPPAGRIIGASSERGHRIRTGEKGGLAGLAQSETQSVDVVIVGGGVAGLTSLRQLVRDGVENCLLLELEDDVGGTARGDDGPITAYPWGAHYLPAPFAENRPLVELLEEMGMVSGYDASGEPIYCEEQLCRDPQERMFANGVWNEDLLPPDRSKEDQAEWQRFRNEIGKWISWRDREGRRAFAIPSELSSRDDRMLELDNMSMADWLSRNEFRSAFVRWQVDYACRDDYGTPPERTSAWAGLFYFASRNCDAEGDSQPFLTWPEGNARITRYLSSQNAARILCGQIVNWIKPSDAGVDVYAQDVASGVTSVWRAKRVIFAASQFLAPHLIDGFGAERGQAAAEFTYAPWLVANLHLSNRPMEPSFPMAWDNVLRDSDGLGYVVATHQTGRDHGPTVLTYYFPVCNQEPRAAREWLQALTWEAAAELVLSDLETAHPDIRELLDRIDFMYWGHAMIRPVPGFRFGAARQICQKPFERIHFANTDLSGVALFEEAFYHGRRAALEVRDCV